MKIATHFILCVGVVLLVTSLGNSQEKIRTLDETNPSFNHPNKPIVIISRELGDKPFLNETQVRGDKDWLKNLRLGIKNVSRKTIIDFHINLVVEKQGKLLTRVDIPIDFGRPEPILDDAGKPTGRYQSSVLKPGEIVNVSVSEGEINHWGKYLKQFEVEDFDSVMVEIRSVHYDDHTGWGAGVETREDPTEPDVWRAVGPDKPVSTLKWRFSDWLASFVPVDATRSSNSQLGSIFPAEGRFFFDRSRNATDTSPMTNTVTCYWYDALDRPANFCFPGTDFCDPPAPGACRKKKDDTFLFDHGVPGTLGHLASRPDECLPTNGFPADACFSCVAGFAMKWVRGCGGDCNEQADTVTYPPTGCTYPYENLNGTCERSLAFQQSCPGGYNHEGCACIPTPTPTSHHHQAAAWKQLHKFIKESINL